MFGTLEEINRKLMKELERLLKEKQSEINSALEEEKINSFKLFGDYILDTASGIAEINIIITDGDLGYFATVQLQKNLTALLNKSVNIYTQQSLVDQFPEHHETKQSKAKSLEEILGLEPRAAAASVAPLAVLN